MATHADAMRDADTPEQKEVRTRLAAIEGRLTAVEGALPEDRVSIIVFSGDLDRVLAAFIIATGAAALGQQVSMFFTFWGFNALRKKRVLEGKSTFEKLMALMSPRGSQGMPVSRMNYFGIGATMLRAMMRNKNVASVEDLMEMSREMGVRMVACDMSRDVMGIRDEEIIDGPEPGGVATFLADGLKSRVTVFI